MSEWKECKLGEIVDVIDSLHQTPKYSIIGYPMVRVTDIKGGYLKTENTLKVAKQVFEVFSKKHKPKKGDIVMSRVGTYGISCIVKNDIDFCLGQNTLFLVPKQNPGFLYYFLNSPAAKNQIESKATGTTQKTISLKSIKEIKVCLPSIFLQTAIAEILSSLDDKIELNNKINQELEILAQTLFKQWFIDFEFPNENGEPYKSSGGEMVDSELGEIPEGWKVVRLSTLLTIKYGKDHKHLSDGIFPLYGSGGIMRYVEKPLYQNSSILIPRKGTLSNLFYLDEPFWSVDTMFYTEIHNPIYGKYLFHCIKELDIASMNVGSAVPSMTTKVLNELTVINPDNSILSKFDEIISSFYETLKYNHQEVKELTNLRDTLLPKLISGELEINEILLQERIKVNLKKVGIES